MLCKSPDPTAKGGLRWFGKNKYSKTPCKIINTTSNEQVQKIWILGGERKRSLKNKCSVKNIFIGSVTSLWSSLSVSQSACHNILNRRGGKLDFLTSIGTIVRLRNSAIHTLSKGRKWSRRLMPVSDALLVRLMYRSKVSNKQNLTRHYCLRYKVTG